MNTLSHSEQANQIYLLPVELVGNGVTITTETWGSALKHFTVLQKQWGSLSKLLPKPFRSRNKASSTVLCFLYEEMLSSSDKICSHCSIHIKSTILQAFNRFHFLSQLNLNQSYSSFSLKDTNWSTHNLTGWKQLGCEVFKLDLKEFKYKISAICSKVTLNLNWRILFTVTRTKPLHLITTRAHNAERSYLRFIWIYSW